MGKLIAALGGTILAYLIVWALSLAATACWIYGAVFSILHHEIVLGIVSIIIPPVGFIVGLIHLL